jgi:hypothetical protein
MATQKNKIAPKAQFSKKLKNIKIPQQRRCIKQMMPAK